MVSSLFQILIGFTGLVGFFLRFIGPLTIAPTITLVGVALFKVAATNAGLLHESMRMRMRLCFKGTASPLKYRVFMIMARKLL